MNFWQTLTKPALALSPMDGVSDAAMRMISAKYGATDITITEFISVDGLTHGAAKIFTDFLYHPVEQPVVAQIYGTDPELFYKSAQIVCELGFDGVDINMGCPAKSVRGRGAGAMLIDSPALAAEIIAATKEACTHWQQRGHNLSDELISLIEDTKQKILALGNTLPTDRKLLPVSVKTRLGVKQIEVERWMMQLLECMPANISLHGRTLKQMYSGVADWSAIALAGEIIAAYNSTKAGDEKITFFANGDIKSPADAQKVMTTVKCDGMLIGRAAQGNPWIFEEIRAALAGKSFAPPTFAQKIQVLLEHAAAHLEIKGEGSFVELRKHFAWYIHGVEGASELRRKLMMSKNLDEVTEILKPI